MVIITAGDGRTTRLMTDGSAVKDESTSVTRSSRWEGDKLVTDMSGLVRGKVTETYVADRESGRLTVTVFFENLPGPMAERAGSSPGRDRPEPRTDDSETAASSDSRSRNQSADGRGRTFTRIYDADRQ